MGLLTKQMINKPIQLIEEEGQPKKLAMPDHYRSQLTTFAYQYLQPNGWFDEELKDEEGYIPWYTYPAIAYLKDILGQDHRVLEYGCGYSSIFYNRRVGDLVTIDHDIEWAKRVVYKDQSLQISVATEDTSIHPEAVPLIHEFIHSFLQCRSDNIQHDMMHGLANHEYAGYASQIYYREKGHFNVIAIDGMARALCAYLAVERIADDGMIILDNSDRWQYNNIHKFLIEKGFNRIDFWGPGHGVHNAWCTSIFSKCFPFKNKNIERPVNNGIFI